MKTTLIYTSVMAAGLALIACKKDPAETKTIEPIANETTVHHEDPMGAGAIEVPATTARNERIREPLDPDEAAAPRGASAEPIIDGRILARAKLTATEGLPGVSGDARFYRDSDGDRVNLALTSATPGAYGVYLGTDCGRVASADPQRTKPTEIVHSQILVSSIDVGADGTALLDAPMPEGYAADFSRGAIMLMPKDNGEPTKKLACGHVIAEESESKSGI